MVNNNGSNNSNNKARKRSKGKMSRVTPPPPPLDPAPVAEQRCYTRISVVPATCEWTITNFSRCQEENGESLVSRTFCGVSNDKLKWYVLLYPKGQKEESKDYLSLFLYLRSYNKFTRLRAEFKFSILNEKRETTMAMESRKAERFISGMGSGFEKFIRRDIVLDDRNGHLTDNTLRIFCEVRAVENPVNISVHSNTAQFKLPECSFSKDLGHLFELRISSDVTLTVGEKEIPAHKAVLAARSARFAAMLHEMEERTGNRLEVTDVNADVLEEMLRFIYTGKSNNLKTMASDLLPAADNYGLERLKVMCTEALCSGLSVENAARVLIFADRHLIDHLKAQAIEFIKNHFAEVTKTNDWTSIMVPSHPRLLGEVFLALATQQIPPIGPSRKRRWEN